MTDQPDREANPYFSQPWRQIAAMVMVLVLVAAGAYVAFPSVAPVFLANPYLNGFILLVFVIGVFACFWQELQLIQSVNWIENFASESGQHDFSKAPRLLAPLAALLRTRGHRMQISATSSRSILDSVATRIDEARDITRYIVNLLIFLGLLGTFYGLATTVPAIVDTIQALAPTEGEDGMAVFGRLMNGLESQLGGMGVAFASSLLGLAGSLVVGLLELFASHGQNRFYRELEEWLSSITRLGFAATDGDGSGEQGMAAAMMEHMAGQIDRLQAMFTNSDVSRTLVDERLGELAGSVGRLTDRLSDQQGSGEILARLADTVSRLDDRLAQNDGEADAMARVASGQERLADVLEAQGERPSSAIDAESRMRLRSIDVQLLRLLEEMSAGRQEATSELRQELRQLSRAINRAQQRPDPPAAALRRG